MVGKADAAAALEGKVAEAQGAAADSIEKATGLAAEPEKVEAPAMPSAPKLP
jgi:hypothetical protein